MRQINESLLKRLYKAWRADKPQSEGPHPDEEDWVDFIEGRLPAGDYERLKIHLLECSRCATNLATSLKLYNCPKVANPAELMLQTVYLKGDRSSRLIELLLKLRGKAIEIVRSNAEVVLGQNSVPFVVLRSQGIKIFKEEVVVTKVVSGNIIEIKVSNENGNYFNICLKLKKKKTPSIIKEFRANLLKEGRELESYYSDSGIVSFLHLFPGSYVIELYQANRKISSIALEVGKWTPAIRH